MSGEMAQPGPTTSLEGWYDGHPSNRDRLVGPVRFSSTGVVAMGTATHRYG